jgi:putative Mn2+ efflux pump MntP
LFVSISYFVGGRMLATALSGAQSKTGNNKSNPKVDKIVLVSRRIACSILAMVIGLAACELIRVHVWGCMSARCGDVWGDRGGGWG